MNDEYIIVGDDGSVTAVAEGIDIWEYVKIIGGTVIKRSDYVPPPYVPTHEELVARENQWREVELVTIANQLLAIEEAEAAAEEGEPPPPDLLPGTRNQWLAYRTKVRAWKESNLVFPNSLFRPERPK